MVLETVVAHLEKIGNGAVYFIFGLIFLFLGRLVWEGITKYKTNQEIFEKDNIAAGIAEFGFLIALAIIISASVKGDAVKGTPIYLDLIVSFIDAVFGLIALGVAKLVLDILTPFKLDNEISVDKNPAVGWLQAGFYIAIAIILFNVI